MTSNGTLISQPETASSLTSSVAVLKSNALIPVVEEPFSAKTQVLARAQHKISLSAIRHNYAVIEKAAARQKCSVIAVVKADAYGHGAALTAKFLVEQCGATAFAVATVEEAIKIRKVFPIDANNQFIRILVLGPPINYPRCFDTYFHYGIEVMVSSSEVAHSLIEWSNDEGGRKLRQVESAASERKEELVLNGANSSLNQNGNSDVVVKPLRSAMLKQNKHELDDDEIASDLNKNIDSSQSIKRRPSLEPDAAAGDILSDLFKNQDVMYENKKSPRKTGHMPSAYSATLSQTSGQHLANEVRSILLNHAEYQKQTVSTASYNSSRVPSPAIEEGSQSSGRASNAGVSTVSKGGPIKVGQIDIPPSRFRGIEDVARNSRHRAVAQQKVHAALRPTPGAHCTQAQRRRLRWHALIDTGMGRLGFKQIDDNHDNTVNAIKKLVDLEMINAPLEFFGMCTHMADAVEGSDYTDSQMEKFVNLLDQIRHKGITVPTCSTDNSSALLTTSLQHFNPSILLQDNSDTRGFVRCGGAIYGQRPAFTQLRAVSTLSARVRHVAIMNPGDSVGYDRAFVAKRKTRIATVSIGFADGYPRDLGNGAGRVSIRGHTFPTAGNICMDMLMIDLGSDDDDDGEWFGEQVEVGDEVILWGPDDSDENDGLIRLQDVARILKTTQSALTCGLNIDRVERKLVP